MKTVIIDYGAGNLHSVYKAFEKTGFKPILSSEPKIAKTADVLVLPGQGHFGQVMRAFLKSGFEPIVRNHLENKKPFLGICVGLQLLLDKSDEAPEVPGLGIIKGIVRKFPNELSVPQMGWNSLEIDSDSPLFKGIKNGSYVYFANSYYASFTKTMSGSTTRYGSIGFQSAISDGFLNATQFHPEKSQSVGLNILSNFKRIAERYS